MEKNGTVLVVLSSLERRQRLVDEITPLGVSILIADGCCQATRLLEASETIDAVITDTSHPDGNWVDVLSSVIRIPVPAAVVVTTPLPSAVLWSEVLWRGVYDMLVEPYGDGEVSAVVGSALRAANERELQREPHFVKASGGRGIRVRGCDFHGAERLREG